MPGKGVERSILSGVIIVDGDEGDAGLLEDVVVVEEKSLARWREEDFSWLCVFIWFRGGLSSKCFSAEEGKDIEKEKQYQHGKPQGSGFWMGCEEIKCTASTERLTAAGFMFPG